MTRRNYQAIAEVLRTTRGWAYDLNGKATVDVIVSELMDVFATDNPNFDAVRFTAAVYD